MSTKLTSYVWDGCAAAGMKISMVAIMARLADFSSDEGLCWPSVGTIARQIGAGESTVRTALAKLEQDGWIVRKQRRNGNRNASNVYQLNVEKLRKAAQSSDSDPSKSDASKFDASKFDASKSAPSESSKKAGFHPSESGGDPSVNSTPEPSDKNSCQLPAETDEPAGLVLNHFNAVTDSSYRDGKTTMGYIRGRLAEDYTPEDLILVVDYLTAKWLNDPKMGDYLRPKTLFGPENCADYFEKAKKWKASGKPACVNGQWVIQQAHTAHWNSQEAWENTL